MAQSHAPCLYVETRLNLDQAHTASTVEITLPSSKTPGIFAETVLQERRIISDVQVGCDEATFAKDHLATDAAVFFRRDGRYPRSFLWRLLDDRRTLEIQSVDLSEDVKEKTEALLTLILRFPAAIRPFCIGFADPDETDAIDIFAITTTNELWTLTLLKDYFVRLKSTEDMPPGWCKSSQPAVLKTTKPYRLFASHSRELFVSLQDGGFLQLTRQAGDDGKSLIFRMQPKANTRRFGMVRNEISRRPLGFINNSVDMETTQSHRIRRSEARTHSCTLCSTLWLRRRRRTSSYSLFEPHAQDMGLVHWQDTGRGGHSWRDR